MKLRRTLLTLCLLLLIWPSLAAAKEEPIIYTVKQGDTLYSIAREHQVTLNALLAANPGVNPKKLKVGQVLKMP